MKRILDILCNQVIDVAQINKGAYSVIDNAKLLNYPIRFVNRIDSVRDYCFNLYVYTENGKHNYDDINDLMIHLMRVLIDYRNSYHKNSYAYRVMNSLLDVVEQSFIEINN